MFMTKKVRFCSPEDENDMVRLFLKYYERPEELETFKKGIREGRYIVVEDAHNESIHAFSGLDLSDRELDYQRSCYWLGYTCGRSPGTIATAVLSVMKMCGYLPLKVYCRWDSVQTALESLGFKKVSYCFRQHDTSINCDGVCPLYAGPRCFCKSTLFMYTPVLEGYIIPRIATGSAECMSVKCKSENVRRKLSTYSCSLDLSKSNQGTIIMDCKDLESAKDILRVCKYLDGIAPDDKILVLTHNCHLRDSEAFEEYISALESYSSDINCDKVVSRRCQSCKGNCTVKVFKYMQKR